jgi:hypothetical protein
MYLVQNTKKRTQMALKLVKRIIFMAAKIQA